MLDTNIVSEAIHDPDGPSGREIVRLGDRRIAVSVIVAAELRYGAAKRGSARLSRLIEESLSRLNVLAFEPPADAHYARLRDHLARLGTPIGANDLLIAAHALALGAPLATRNRSEFSRAPGLAIVDWPE